MSLKKLKPIGTANQIELLYGINKIKSAIYILSQHEEESDNASNSTAMEAKKRVKISSNASVDEKMKMLMELRMSLVSEKELTNEAQTPKNNEMPAEEKYDIDTITNIMNSLFEHGPDLGYFSFLLINNVKQLKQIGMKRFNDFEYRIGARMSGDDAYTLFSSESFVNKADEKTVVYYAGSSKNCKTLRPYLLPNEAYFEKINKVIH